MCCDTSPFKVGNVATAAQVVRVVVELHLFVVVIRLEVAVYSSCACHCTSLCRLRRTIVAAELSCKREESELAQAFPSAADNVLLDKPDHSHSRHCPYRCKVGQTLCNCL